MLAIKLNGKCCVIDCEQPATVFTEGLVLCPKHYIEMDREHKKLIFKKERKDYAVHGKYT